jgi:serine protease Do
MRNTLLSVWAALCLTAWAEAAPLTTLPPDGLKPVAKQAMRSAVKVLIVKSDSSPRPATMLMDDDPDAVGSGVVFRSTAAADEKDAEVLILTNNHVVAGAKKIGVRLVDRREFVAELIGTDPITEVAILRIRVPKDKAPPPMPLRKTDIEVGDWALSIGSPLNQSFSFTAGWVSAIGRRPGIGTGLEDYIQHQAPINSGNSGGPLFDIDGNLVGLNTAILGGRGNIGIAFAIPADLAVEMADRMLANDGKVWHGFVGLKIDDGPDGVVVLRTMPRPGTQQPFKQGDVITAFNGEKVTGARQCRRLVDRAKSGESVRATVSRAGQSVELQVLMDDLAKYIGD